MRKITQKMVEAVKAKRSWDGGNTKVIRYHDSITVRLFGNTIAMIKNDKLILTTAGRNTKTTLERLNGLLTLRESRDCRVFVRNHKLFYRYGNFYFPWIGSGQSFGQVKL